MSDINITTTQNVKLFFSSASIGERMLAFLIDNLIKTAYIIVIYLIFLLGGIYNLFIESESEVVMLTIAILSIPVVFYTLFFESLFEGQTPGKMLMKIKVLKIDGYQAAFFDYFVRWIFILVDINLFYLPGMISILFSKKNQRLGDMAAGTAVITEKSKYNISHTILMNIEDEYQPTFTHNQVILFSDNDIRIIKENLELAIRQKNLDIINKLARKIELVMGTFNPFDRDRRLIEVLLKDYNFHTGKL